MGRCWLVAGVSVNRWCGWNGIAEAHVKTLVLSSMSDLADILCPEPPYPAVPQQARVQQNVTILRLSLL